MNYPEQLTRVSSAAGWRIRCLGRFRLEDSDGFPVRVRTRKARAALAHLALCGGLVSRDQLASVLWSDRREEQARASVRQTIFELRHIAGGNLLSASHDEVALEPQLLATDLSLIRDAAQRGDCYPLRELLAQSGDTLLADLDGLDPEFDDWLRGQRAKEPAATLAAATAAAERCLATDGARAAQPLAAEILRLDPTSEEATRLMLRIDHDLGDGAALHRHYAALRDRLDEDYSTEPTSETQALFTTLTAPGCRQPASRKAVSEAEPATPQPATRARSRRWPAAAALLLLLAAVGVLAVLFFRQQAAPSRDGAPIVVAVLPFDSPGSKDDFLASGLWEQTLAALGRNSSLRLLGRISTAAMAAQKQPPEQYRRRFGVTHLLEGSVRRSGDRLLVSVSLTRTSDGVSVWQDMFRARMGEPFSLEDAIARGIEGKLRGRLAPHGGIRAEQIATTPEVFALYSEARALISSRDHENMLRAEALVREAVAKDPNFAPAWSLLGLTTHFNGRVAIVDSQTRAQALAAVRRAMALAPNLAQAQAAFAMLQGENSPDSERALRRAIALDPNDAETWMWLGNSLANQFRGPEAVAAYERAVELDPLFERAVQNLAGEAALSDDRGALERLLRRITRAGASRELIASVRAKQLYGEGDYSGAVKVLLEVGLDARHHSPNSLWGNWLETLTALGDFDALHTVTGCPEWYAPLLRGTALPPSRFDGRPVAPEEFWTSGYFSSAASRAMVNHGRSRDLVRIYRAGFRNADEFISQTKRHGMLLELAPTVAVALDETGEKQEAAYILSVAANQVRAAGARSDSATATSELAAIRAAQGERGQALSLLESAVGRGWLPDGRQNPLDLAQEPAFQALRGDRRFENLRRRILAHVARERAELGPIPV